MRYLVLVESPRNDRRDGEMQHRCMYDGDSLDMAHAAARSYTRPIDDLSAEVIQVATEADGLGWVGERVVKET